MSHHSYKPKICICNPYLHCISISQIFSFSILLSLFAPFSISFAFAYLTKYNLLFFHLNFIADKQESKLHLCLSIIQTGIKNAVTIKITAFQTVDNSCFQELSLLSELFFYFTWSRSTTKSSIELSLTSRSMSIIFSFHL